MSPAAAIKGALLLALLSGLLPSAYPAHSRHQAEAETDAAETLAPLRPGLTALALPLLTDLEPAVAEQIRELQGQMSALAQSDPDPNTIAGGYAVLGEFYHCYNFLDQAETCYRNALSLKPGDFEVLYLLGHLCQASGRPDQAQSSWMEASKINARYTPVWINLGELALLKNDLASSRRYFEKALELDPNSAASHFGLGRVAQAEGQIQSAIDSFERTLALAPEADKIHYSLGLAYRKIGNSDAARQHLSQTGKVGVKAADPILERLTTRLQSERLFVVRGKTAFAAGRYAEAEREFRQALAINPNSINALVNLGSALALQDRAELAVAQYGRVLELEENNQTVHFNLGYLFRQMGRNPEAAVHLRRALALKPDDHQAKLMLAGLLAIESANGEALELYNQLAIALPDSEEVSIQHALLLFQRGDYPGVAANLARAWERNPTLGRLTHFYARFLASCPNQSLRDGPKAYDLAQRVVAVSPTVEHIETLAMACAEKGSCEEAVIWQERAIEIAQREGNSRIMDRMRRDLNHYREQRPCRIAD